MSQNVKVNHALKGRSGSTPC